ncbi:hypothetical protein EOK75_20420 (plasmid) [Pseudorhodobacter turbinis]|uniref:Glycosyltransferase RgtA/B/C/D-like domain-containing protein n=2 Tax=Pseudorhodobacter turbinis TaxID=2500533 RepID=A0A4V1E1H2_9RHOB|nr:hypothetical protein EOK75_20420 [Pseudorhodobacter turbinis]
MFFIFVPIAYDTLFLQDTMFFSDLGWRVLNGAKPTEDFGHFYGGVIAQYIAWAFQIFGTGVKSIDYAFVMMLATACALAALVAWRRLSLFTMVALCMILFAALLARVPLEELTAVQRPAATHAFIYNRFAAGLAAILTLFALIPARDSRSELLAAFICGAFAYLIVLIKPTFVPFVPAFLASLALRARWQSCFIASLGLVAGLLILDPGADRALAAFAYGVASAGGNTTIPNMIMKTAAVFFVQPLTMLSIFAVGAVLVFDRRAGTVQFLLAGLALTIGYAGMTTTMGWHGDVGQQALPFMAALCLAGYEWGRHGADRLNDQLCYLRITAACVVMAFSLPQLVQTCLSGALAVRRAPLIQMTGTPLDSYLAWSDEFVGADRRPFKQLESLDIQIQAAKAHIAAEKSGNAGLHYVMLIDAVMLLRSVPGIVNRGIAGDMSFFPFIMQAPPINGFPAWLSLAAPELAEGKPLPEGIDLMMIRKVERSAMSLRLLTKMEGRFTRCLGSNFWDLYVRDGTDAAFCGTING